MGNKLYVGNLSYSATNETLTNEFSKFGTVDSCNIITDRDTGRSKGFGFIEMSTEEEAQEAISSLNGAEVDGRQIKVNEAKPQERRGNSSGRDRNNRW